LTVPTLQITKIAAAELLIINFNRIS
jgi:hypothetical protein